jgi:hypothetical protein
MWLASDPSVEPTPWRALSVKDNGKNEFEILAATYSAGKYTYVDNGVLIPPPSFSLIPTGPLKGPTGIGVREYIYLDPVGTILASSNPVDISQNVGQRDYFRNAMAGDTFITGVSVSTITNAPSIFHSAPVKSADGSVLGVVRSRATLTEVQNSVRAAGNRLGAGIPTNRRRYVPIGIRIAVQKPAETAADNRQIRQIRAANETVCGTVEIER